MFFTAKNRRVGLGREGGILLRGGQCSCRGHIPFTHVPMGLRTCSGYPSLKARKGTPWSVYNISLPSGCPLGHGVCWLALGREDENVRQGERKEARTSPSKFHLRGRKDGCCSCLQASHLKLLRTDEKGWLCACEEGLTQLGQSGWAHQRTTVCYCQGVL